MFGSSILEAAIGLTLVFLLLSLVCSALQEALEARLKIRAFALSFGAPFWFDMLNKLMVVRSTVKPHEKSPEVSSGERQRGETPFKSLEMSFSPAGVLPVPVAPLETTPFVPHVWADGEDPHGGEI